MKNVGHYDDEPDIMLMARGTRKGARVTCVRVPAGVCITGVCLDVLRAQCRGHRLSKALISEPYGLSLG